MHSKHGSVVIVAGVLLAGLVGCAPTTPVATSSPSESSSTPSASPTPTAPVFVQPADCAALIGPTLEAEFAGKDITLFYSSAGDGDFDGQGETIVPTQDLGTPFWCLYGQQYVDGSTFEFDVQPLDAALRATVIAELDATGWPVTTVDGVSTYSLLGTENGEYDANYISVVHPDAWITARSTFGGQTSYDLLAGRLAVVTANVYPAP